MSEEVLIPKMRRLDGKQKKVKIPINNFILVILCTLLIVCATFINIDIKHYIIPQGFSFGKTYTPQDFIYSFSIIPQIPVLMFTCSVLGRKLALTSTCLFVILGLFAIPVFALGGGLGYIGEYSFGYILAFIPAVFVAGSFLYKKYSFLNMVLAAITGALVIHLCGILYMMIIALIKSNGEIFIKTWIHSQSGVKIIYDIVLSFIGILIGKYIHEFLKFLAD
jgi:biotin transporter BioY